MRGELARLRAEGAAPTRRRRGELAAGGLDAGGLGFGALEEGGPDSELEEEPGVDRRLVGGPAPEPEGLALPAGADPLLQLAELEDAEQFKIYQVNGPLSRPRLAWLATLYEAPEEEQLLSIAGPGRYAVRALAPGGLVLAEVLVVLSTRAGQAGHIGQAPAPAASGDFLRLLAPHIPALIQAIRSPAAAAAGVAPAAPGVGELLKLYQVLRQMQEDALPPEAPPEAPAGPGLVEAAAGAIAGAPGMPWWAPIAAQVAAAIGGAGATPADLSPSTVAQFLSKPGALVQVVTQLQGTPEGAQLLEQIREALK